jgi:hypothetical protein
MEKTMLNAFKLIVDHDRFYVTTRLWFYYGLLGTVLAAMVSGSYALYVHEDAEPILKYIFIACTAIGFLSILKDKNGKGGRKYGFKGKLNWGGNARGLFVKSLEGRVSEYDWSRVQKITIAEKITVPNSAVVEGVYFSAASYGQSAHSVSYTHQHRVIVYFDRINPSESKTGQLIHDKSAIRDATALPLYYGCTTTDEILELIKKYAPQSLDIDVIEHLNLVRNG